MFTHTDYGLVFYALTFRYILYNHRVKKVGWGGALIDFNVYVIVIKQLD